MMKLCPQAARIWSAVTCHRFCRFGDLSPKQGRVQPPGRVGRIPPFDGDQSPAESADESAHSKLVAALPRREKCSLIDDAVLSACEPKLPSWRGNLASARGAPFIPGSGMWAQSRVPQSKAWPAQQRTFLTLWRTSSFTALRAGPRYLRGSNSFGFSKNTLRMAAVIARRRSVSILTLVQPTRRATSMSASGTPAVSSPSLPPYLLISAAYSFGTLEAP